MMNQGYNLLAHQHQPKEVKKVAPLVVSRAHQASSGAKKHWLLDSNPQTNLGTWDPPRLEIGNRTWMNMVWEPKPKAEQGPTRPTRPRRHLSFGTPR
jgi:hypothetical protein